MLKRVAIAIIVMCLSLLSCVYALNKEDDEFYKAVEVYSKGMYKNSITLFHNFIDAHPNSSKLYAAKLYVAKSLYFRGNYLEAAGIVNKIVANKEAKSIYSEAYYWLAKIYYVLGEYNSASKCALRVIDDYPGSRFLWSAKYLLSQIYLRENNTVLARRTLKEIISGGCDADDADILDNAYLEIMELYYKEKDYKDLYLVTSKYLKDRPQGDYKDRVYFYRAESCYYQDNYGEAVEWYNKALNVHPENGILRDSIYQGRGMSFLAEGDLNKAKLDFSKIRSKEYKLFSESMYYFNTRDYIMSLNELDKFLKEFPDSRLHTLASLREAELLYRMGRLKDALYLYKKVINDAELFCDKKVVNDAYYGLGWCYVKSGYFKEAIKAFRKIVKSTSDTAVKISSLVQIADSYKETGDFDKALFQYKDILNKYPRNMYADYIYFQIGMIMLDKKNLNAARINFAAVLNKFPSSHLAPDAMYYIGRCYMLDNKTDKAKSEFSRFIKNYPHCALAPKACYLYSKCLIYSKDYKKALIYLDRVINSAESKKLRELACIGRIQLYYQLYSLDKALNESRRFFRLFPSSKMAAVVYLYVGKIYQARRDFSKAEHFYQIVIDNYSNASVIREAEFSLGVLYFGSGDFQKARCYFSGLSEGNDFFSREARSYLAEIFVNEGDKEKALAVYKSIIQGSREVSESILLRYALLLKDMKKCKEANDIFRRIIKINGGSSRVRFMLGFCLERLNKPDEAVEEYSKIVYNSKDINDKIKAYFRIARIYKRHNDTAKAEEAYRKIIATGRPEAKVAARRLKELKIH